MSMIQLEQALQLIQANRDQGYFVGPREEQLITAGETALGVLFPATYRRFLGELGCGDFAGAEFYGLIDENFASGSVPNGIWLTLKLRRTNALPKSFVVVSDTGDGGYYAIDTSQRDSQGESPIVAWYPGGLSKGEKLSNDFGTFILQRVSKALQ
jgi:hypothetical protein